MPVSRAEEKNIKNYLEDVLQATNKRLARLPVNTDVRKHSSYIVTNSDRDAFERGRDLGEASTL